MLEGRGQAANDALAVVNDSQVSAPAAISYFLPDPWLFYSFETGALPLVTQMIGSIIYIHPVNS